MNIVKYKYINSYFIAEKTETGYNDIASNHNHRLCKHLHLVIDRAVLTEGLDLSYVEKINIPVEDLILYSYWPLKSERYFELIEKFSTIRSQ